MRMRKSFWFATLAVVALGLVTGATVADRVLHEPVQYAEASWAKIFDSPAALARTVDVIVLAQAVDVAPGRVALSDKGEGALPFQLVDFEVIHGLKGAAAGERLTLERAGGDGVRITADGGEFTPGEVYLLFLQQQQDGPYLHQVNYQGRYHLQGDHLLAAAPDDPVATQLHGVTLTEAMARVGRLLGEGTPARVLQK